MKGWFRGLPRRLPTVAAGVVLALAAVVAGASAASAADSGNLSYPACGVNEASVDNSPGNGAASWAWLWRHTWPSETVLRIEFYNGSHTFLELYGSETGTSSSYWNDDIWRVRIQCYLSWNPGAGYGPWAYFDRG